MVRLLELCRELLDATEAEPPCPPLATRPPGRRPATAPPLGVLRSWSGGGGDGEIVVALLDAAGAAAVAAAGARGRRLGGSAAADDDVLCPFSFIFSQSVSTLSVKTQQASNQPTNQSNLIP